MDNKLVIIAITFVLWLGGGIIYCYSTATYHRYKLSDGETVECKFVGQDRCGLSFTTCKDGNKYECQTNVITLGK